MIDKILSPPLPDAPSAADTNNEISRALVTSPSPVSPRLHQSAGARNLFQDGTKTGDTSKRAGELPSMGYSPAKKKGGPIVHGAGGGHHTCGDGISPRDAFDVYNNNALDVCNANGWIDSDDNGDESYSTTRAYKKLIQARHKPKTHDPKVILNSSYYAFICPITFNTKQFLRGHSQVYSKEQMRWFDADFQKQLTFNFCATRATRKKSVTINSASASRMRDVDLDVTPTLFSVETTGRHE